MKRMTVWPLVITLLAGCQASSNLTSKHGDTAERFPAPVEVVYIVDASEKMVDYFDYVRPDLVKSIARLTPNFDFQVLLINKGEIKQIPADGLVPAMDENMIATVEKLEKVLPTGAEDPSPALKRAFEVLHQSKLGNPRKMIFLYSSGKFPDGSAVLDLVRKDNSDRKIHIYVTQYGDDKRAAELLRAIAKENGGQFTQIARRADN